jgi:hypothetical protein
MFSYCNMEAVLIVPTQKTITHVTSRDDQLRIQTLFNEAGWETDEILHSLIEYGSSLKSSDIDANLR